MLRTREFKYCALFCNFQDGNLYILYFFFFFWTWGFRKKNSMLFYNAASSLEEITYTFYQL